MIWVIVTGKGDAYIINGPSAAIAITQFHKHRPGAEVAQCFEAILLQSPSRSGSTSPWR